MKYTQHLIDKKDKLNFKIDLRRQPEKIRKHIEISLVSLWIAQMMEIYLIFLNFLYEKRIVNSFKAPKSCNFFGRTWMVI